MKKCPFCVEEIQDEAIKCKHCGSILENKEKEANLKEINQVALDIKNEEKEETKDQVIYFSVSPLKLIILSIFTLDIYYIYWFSKNWRIVKENEKSDISAGLRGWMVIFFCYPLFKKIYQSAKKNGYRESHSPGLLATAFIILLLLGRADNGIWLLSCLNFLPILVIQKIINFNNKQVDNDYKVDGKFSGWEIFFSLLGGVVLFLMIAGTFADSSNNTLSKNTVVNNSSLNNSETLESTLVDVAAEINKESPQMIDKITQLTGASSSGKELNYSYKLITTAKYSQADLNKSLRNGIVNNVCQNSGMKSLLDLGAAFNYNYYDNQGKQFGKISINSADCK